MNKQDLTIAKKCLKEIIDEKYELEDENIENGVSSRALKIEIECLNRALLTIEDKLDTFE